MNRFTVFILGGTTGACITSALGLLIFGPAQPTMGGVFFGLMAAAALVGIATACGCE